MDSRGVGSFKEQPESSLLRIDGKGTKAISPRRRELEPSHPGGRERAAVCVGGDDVALVAFARAAADRKAGTRSGRRIAYPHRNARRGQHDRRYDSEGSAVPGTATVWQCCLDERG